MKRLLLAAVWLAIAVVVALQVRDFDLPFNPRLPGKNLKQLLYKKKPRMMNLYEEQSLDDQLAIWHLTGPIHLALLPMYGASPLGNAGFLSSFINHGEVVLRNEPYPHPKLSITEKFRGDGIGYQFDDRSTNASLYISNGADVWPLGYTAWYDLVMRRRYVTVPTPRLIDGQGNEILPTSGRVVHPLNTVTVFGDNTIAEMQHWSPIVWTFPTEGKLKDPKPGYAIASAADGAEVSYLPPLPTLQEQPLGVFLLAPLVAPTTSDAPQWWGIDQRLRRAVLESAPVEERRALVRRLAAAYPDHPLLPHYRILAEFGGPAFDATWLRAQSKQCEMPSWYLVSWTHLPWSTVQKLPCLAELPPGKLDCRGEYIAESVVLAFRAQRDDTALQELASRVIDRSYLRREFRGFNYPLSDFAWLWLKARP